MLGEVWELISFPALLRFLSAQRRLLRSRSERALAALISGLSLLPFSCSTTRTSQESFAPHLGAQPDLRHRCLSPPSPGRGCWGPSRSGRGRWESEAREAFERTAAEEFSLRGCGLWQTCPSPFLLGCLRPSPERASQRRLGHVGCVCTQMSNAGGRSQRRRRRERSIRPSPAARRQSSEYRQSCKYLCKLLCLAGSAPAAASPRTHFPLLWVAPQGMPKLCWV